MRRVRSRSAAPLTQVHAPGSRPRLLRGPRPSRRPRPAPTSAPAPTLTPPMMIAPEPIEAPRSITVSTSSQSSSVCSAPAVGRRPRPLVVDEHHAVADEDLVLDRDARADERVALDLAARADLDARLDLDERADAREVSDPAPVEVRERLDEDAFAEVHVARSRYGASFAGAPAMPLGPVEEVRDRLDDGRELLLGDARVDRAARGLRARSPLRPGTRPAHGPGPRRRPRGAAAPDSAGPSRPARGQEALPAAPGSPVRITYRCQTGLLPSGTGGSVRSPTPASASRVEARGAARRESFHESRCGSLWRSTIACSVSMRAVKPAVTCLYFSVWPCSRSARTRSASSRSSVTSAPASPIAPRFFAG